ncbi:cold-shock DNA-binding domain-containing protein [Erysipelothrix rhusiopathiae SY1027]|nr:cold-shock DNA-binding domain-containing protein [Erysipelothrix rhusiopathiae SY1027]
MDKTYFFHYTHLIMEGFKTIEEGTEVEFELVESERGLQAHNIVRI